MDKSIQFLLPVLAEIKQYHSCWERSLFWLFFRPIRYILQFNWSAETSLGDCCRRRLKGGTEILPTPHVPYFPMFCICAMEGEKVLQRVMPGGCNQDPALNRPLEESLTLRPQRRWKRLTLLRQTKTSLSGYSPYIVKRYRNHTKST